MAAIDLNSRLALSIKEATIALGVSRSFLYQQIKLGRLQAYKLGGRTLLMAADIQSWLAALQPLQQGQDVQDKRQ